MPQLDTNEKLLSLPLLDNGEHIIEKANRVLSTNFPQETENQKVEGLITYSIDQQFFKF